MTDERRVINLAQRKLERLGGLPAPDISVTIPEFIEPSDISKMSDEQLEQVLQLVRLRRMQSTLIYEQTQVQKQQIQDEKNYMRLDKASIKVFTKLEKAFKALDDLELAVNEMRAWRLQSGLEF